MVCVELSFEVKGFVFFFLGGVGGGSKILNFRWGLRDLTHPSTCVVDCFSLSFF